MDTTINSRLDTALVLANAGIKVYPLAQYSKSPARGFLGGEHNATTNTDQIKAWFNANPYFNLAINLKESGLAVLDLDNHPVKNTKDKKDKIKNVNGVNVFRDYLKRNNIDGNFLHTYAEHTPHGGGFHFFFNHKGKLPKKDMIVMPGVELLTDKVITAPSRIINRNEGVDGSYTPVWNNCPTLDKNALQTLPQWIIDIAKTREEKKHHTNTNYRSSGKRWTGRLLDELVQGAPQGERHNWLVHIISKLFWTGADAETVYNLACFCNSMCDVPLPDKEVDETFTSLLKREVNG